MKRIAIVTTHPIQYYAPLFRVLNERKIVDIKVFYTWGDAAKNKVFDPGFGKQREWDIPLLEGYKYEFVKNVSKSPGSSHFYGIKNPDIIQRIDEYHPDALLVQGWAFQSHLKVLRHYKGKVPIFFRGDSTLLDESRGFSFKKIARRLFLTWVYKHIDKAFYVGTNNKEYYKVHGLKESQLVYTPHAIDNNRFFDFDNSYHTKAVQWKKELKIPDNKVVVLFAGKLEKKKNPFFIIEAAKQMPQLHFIIVGSGILENELKNASQNLRNLTILPFRNQSQMPIVYRLADIFVLPSKGPGETWGLAINEAMASCRVVIASNKCGGAIDLVKEGETGFIIKPDLMELIAILIKVSKDKNYLQRLKNASESHIKNFNLEYVANSIEQEVITIKKTNNEIRSQ